MTLLITISVVALPLAGFVGYCFGYYFGAKSEANQMQQMYRTVNTTKQPNSM